MAVRLEDVASPGQIVCSEATYRLIRGQFQCSDLGHESSLGIAVRRGLPGSGRRRRAELAIEAAGPAGLTPLTGRDHEISLLRTAGSRRRRAWVKSSS